MTCRGLLVHKLIDQWLELERSPFTCLVAWCQVQLQYIQLLSYDDCYNIWLWDFLWDCELNVPHWNTRELIKQSETTSAVATSCYFYRRATLCLRPATMLLIAKHDDFFNVCEDVCFLLLSAARLRWCSARQRNHKPQLKVNQFTVNKGPSPASSSRAWSCLGSALIAPN